MVLNPLGLSVDSYEEYTVKILFKKKKNYVLKSTKMTKTEIKIIELYKAIYKYKKTIKKTN